MMTKILLLISTILLFIGCGGSGSGSNKTFSGTMVVSQNYTVFPGDSVIKGSDTAVISVTHKDGEAESTITLIEGNVTIVRKP
jgi:uncharacterized lipoprotein YajG